MNESVFTKIINGELPCYKLYEDERTIAILTIEPNVVGHTLVIPKVQIDQFNDLDDEMYYAVWKTVKKVANNNQQKLGTDRIGLSVKGVDVPHTHVHVLPFNVGNHMGKHEESPELTHDEFKKLTARLRFDD